MNTLTGELPERIAEIAGTALENGPDPDRTGCVLGSVYGSGHVAETIRARLDAGARSSLAPESFVYFNAHGVTSMLCLRHQLRGFSTTVLGVGAGMQALGVSLRRMQMGGCQALLCGGYELLSPAAAAALGSDLTNGWAAFLLLETADSARVRGAEVLAEIGSVEVGPAASGPASDVRATAPIADIAAALTLRTPLVDPVTAVAMGRRHIYRCTVRAAA
ncbi:hypothetical protein [Rhodococcus sp. ABRD24]|uniref:hypothetical protein n=1 Tax=Rhodococcus sp. ABRD24 TaxID=2507582 RepID=UPI001A95611F|nr:hypothetical protein [Rhodococcus sp. ABRD24]